MLVYGFLVDAGSIGMRSESGLQQPLARAPRRDLPTAPSRCRRHCLVRCAGVPRKRTSSSSSSSSSSALLIIVIIIVRSHLGEQFIVFSVFHRCRRLSPIGLALAMPRGTATAQWLARHLLKMDWKTRHEHLSQIGRSHRVRPVHDEVLRLLSPDQVLQGAGGALEPHCLPPVLVASVDPKRARRLRQAKVKVQTTLHQYFKLTATKKKSKQTA